MHYRTAAVFLNCPLNSSTTLPFNPLKGGEKGGGFSRSQKLSPVGLKMNEAELVVDESVYVTKLTNGINKILVYMKKRELNSSRDRKYIISHSVI